jgi:hypothetical protein
VAPDSRNRGKIGGLFSSLIASNRLPLFSLVLGEGKKQAMMLERKPEIIIGSPRQIIDQIRLKTLSPEAPTLAVFAPDAGPAGEGDQDLSFIAARLSPVSTLLLCPGETAPRLSQTLRLPRNALKLGREAPGSAAPGEAKTPAPAAAQDLFSPEIPEEGEKKGEDSPLSGAIRESLEALRQRIQEDGDREGMDLFKKSIRRYIPLTMRVSLAAYLFRAYFKGDPPLPPRREREEPGEVGGGFVTVFFSAGKNRRIFPQDLTGFIKGALNPEAGELGSLKITDNCSFVQMKPALAKKAVALLNGKELKGRTVTVNYGRKK